MQNIIYLYSAVPIVLKKCHLQFSDVFDYMGGDIITV